MRLLVDNQLPVALSRFLESQGLECRHVLDVNLGAATDLEIWRYAQSHEYVIVSKDEDFLHLSNSAPVGPAVVWVRLGNCRKTTLLAAFSRLLPELLAALNSGQRLVEIR